MASYHYQLSEIIKLLERIYTDVPNLKLVNRLYLSLVFKNDFFILIINRPSSVFKKFENCIFLLI